MANRLIPFKQLSKITGKKTLADTSIIVNEKGMPVGFFFGRDSFVALMTLIDEQFEHRVENAIEAYDNFAGKIIDAIEEKLPIKPEFEKDLHKSIKEAKKSGWVSFEKIKDALNV